MKKIEVIRTKKSIIYNQVVTIERVMEEKLPTLENIEKNSSFYYSYYRKGKDTSPVISLKKMTWEEIKKMPLMFMEYLGDAKNEIVGDKIRVCFDKAFLNEWD